MGFALTVVYVALTIISPEQFGPGWAHYHALAYLAGLTAIFSLPNMLGNLRMRSSIQTYLLLGFVLAIALSQVANGWFGGVVDSWTKFLPSAVVFFFVVANVTTIRRLKTLTLVSVASCLIVVVEALCGYYGGFRGETFVLQQSLYSHDQVVGQIARLRGAGFLSDPNDFAQILLIALPLVFVAWRRRRVQANVVFVLVPSAVILWAVYLTHSRGALLALAVLAVMVARKRIGTTTSVILTTALIVGMLALDFTGGRAISAVEGADRLESWATGLELLKSAPLFGIGFGGYTDFNEITAHNSLVLCLAELGLVGATLWLALLVTTMTGLNRIIRQQRKGLTQQPRAECEAAPEEIAFAEARPLVDESPCTEAIATASSDLEIVTRRAPAVRAVVPPHWVMVMRLALVAFVVTGWFLSRGYDTPLFLILGLATATITLQGPAAVSRARSRWLSHTLVVETVAIIFIYGIVRFRS